MEADRKKWNARFAERDPAPLDPEPFLVDHIGDLIPGRVLDVACGDGRNALFLAGQGFDVVGVDVSDVGLERLRRFAERDELPVSAERIDLDQPDELRDLGHFDDIVISHFKPDDPFWNVAPDLLVPGGRLLMVTFGIRQHEEHGFPARFCLEPGELRDVSDSLDALFEEEFERDGQFMVAYLFERVARS